MPNISNTQKISTINSVQDFIKILARESNRVNRYTTKLSLIIYEIGSKNERDLAVRQFIRIMARRVRNMDDIGWFDLDQIGVLLPHTPTGGAFKLSEDIAALLSSNPIPLPFTIYSYPSQRWPVKKRIPLLLRLRLSLQDIFRPHNITASDDFRIYLSLEIDRATRYGYVFSLLIFHFTKANASRKTLKKLVRNLNGRLRETDEIGWYGSEKIAAILPYADNINCQAIANTICEAAAIATEAAFTIYTYPTQWPTDKSFDPPLPITEVGETINARIKQTQANVASQHSEKENEDASVNRMEDQGQWSRNFRPVDVDKFIAKSLPTWKRGADILISCLALTLCAPLFVFAALGIKATSPGPILFRQKRVGFMQKQFLLFKFRTMHADADSKSHRELMRELISKNGDKADTKISQDKRIFPFGRLLRKSSIDELPQLFNVLRGEMSLIGPRPCLPYEAEEYLRWHTRRFLIMPGLTGLWQVSGKNKLSFKQMIRLDITYEKNLSIWLDLKILCKTIPTIISIFLSSSE